MCKRLLHLCVREERGCDRHELSQLRRNAERILRQAYIEKMQSPISILLRGRESKCILPFINLEAEENSNYSWNQALSGGPGALSSSHVHALRVSQHTVPLFCSVVVMEE